MQISNFIHQNQFIIYDENKTTFQSYQSTIATIDKTNHTLTIFDDWNYSQTTKRHFKAFIEQFTSLNYSALIEQLNKGQTIFSLN